MLRSRSAAAFALGIAVLASGCSDPRLTIASRTLGPSSPATVPQAAADDAHGWADWHPLALGNWWRYAAHTRIRYVPTGEVPGPWVSSSPAELMFEIVCTTTFNGREYLVEEVRAPGGGRQWYPFRQDATGLYRAPVDVSRPQCAIATDLREAPADYESSRQGLSRRFAATLVSKGDPETLERAAQVLESQIAATERQILGSGVITGIEWRDLAYPLRPGRTWDHFASSATVTGRERLDVPDVGVFHTVVVEYHNPNMGPDDRSVAWRSRDGLVRRRSVLFFDWVDETGQRVGTIEIEGERQLTSWFIDGVLHEPSFP